MNLEKPCGVSGGLSTFHYGVNSRSAEHPLTPKPFRRRTMIQPRSTALSQTESAMAHVETRDEKLEMRLTPSAKLILKTAASAIRAFAVDAKDDGARSFYEDFGFTPLPSDTYHLF